MSQQLLTARNSDLAVTMKLRSFRILGSLISARAFWMAAGLIEQAPACPEEAKPLDSAFVVLCFVFFCTVVSFLLRVFIFFL